MLRDIIRTLGQASAKAHSAGILAALLALGSPALDGFRDGLTPYLSDIGATVGAALGAYLLGHLSAWLPRNKPAP